MEESNLGNTGFQEDEGTQNGVTPSFGAPPGTTEGTPPQLYSPTAENPPPPAKARWFLRFKPAIKWTGLALLLSAILIGSAFVIRTQRSNGTLQRAESAEQLANRFNSLQLPLDELVQQGALVVNGGQSLVVNGQLKANNTLVISPTTQPNNAVAGQIYYDRNTNLLVYFNGVDFVALDDEEAQRVSSLGGASGDIAITGGLALVGGALTNSGVLSVQGQTGTVVLTGGNGISVSGTTIANIGVLSLGGQTGDVAVGNGLTADNGELRNNGVITLTAGTLNLQIADDGAGNLTISDVGGGSGTVASSGGTAGRIAVFTAAQTIEDSLLSQAAGTVTANGNFSVTGNLSLANALTVVNGGTGATSLAANGVLLGNGTGAISSLVAGLSGQCLMSTAGAPTWQTCPGGGGVLSLNGATGALSIANATEAGGVITINNASTSQKGIAQFNGTNFTVAGGVVNTIQNIDPTANPTFAAINTSAIVPNGTPLIVGSTSEDLTMQGTNILINRTNGANTTSLNFAAPTANVTYVLQTAAAGTYDVCTSAGNCVGVGGAVSTPGGTANRLAKFTAAQTIADSIIGDNGTTVTVNGNLSVTGITTLSTPLAISSGGTGATTALGARTNLGAAASGANSDITSLSGLTTALSVVQGGTGATSFTANGVLIGNGTSPISAVAAGGAGLCLVSTVGAPVWQACPGSGGVTSVNGQSGAVTIANASAAAGTITINDASTSQKGIAQFNATNFSVTSGNVNTVQDIHAGATPTFAGINTNSITPSGPLTIGSTSQNLTLQGAATTITSTNGANTATLSFVAPTANVTYRLQTAAAGTYDVCTTAGNCTGVGGGVSTPGGTTNQLAKFTGAQTIADSIISDDGSVVTVAGDLTVTGVTTLTTPLAVTSGGTGANTAAGARTSLGAAASGANSDITSLSGLTTALSVTQGGTGATSLTANGVLLGNGTGAISSLAAGVAGQCLVSTAGAPVWQACPGGGGVSSLNGLSGALTIANASAAGSTITINDASTSQKGIAQFNSTNFTVASGNVNTIQNINVAATPTFGALTLSSSQATSPMLLVNNTNAGATGNLIDLQLNGVSQLAVTPAGNMTLSGTINGQTISSAANFTGSVTVAGAASLNGGAMVTGTLTANTITPTGAMTIGSTAQNLTMQGAAVNLTSTSGANTTTLAFQTPTANVTYRLQTAAAGTYDICTSVGNCTGVGGGVTTPGGTTNALAKFTGSQTLGDSIISDDGSTVTIGGVLAANTITPTAAMTIGATGQDLTLQGAAVSLSATDAGITNTLSFATPSGSNKSIVVPNASGTVAVSASGPLQLDASGNISCPLCVTSGGGGGGAGAVDSLNGLTGALTLANATGAGSTITIDDASTSTKGIAQFNSTNFTVTGGVVNTVQDINTTAAPTFGRLTVTSSQATNQMMVVNNTNASGTGNLLALQLNGANRFTVDPAGNVVANGTITSGTINGQTISSAANFTGSLAVAGAANLNGGASVTGTLSVNTITPTSAMVIGSTGQNLTLQGAVTSLNSTSGANTSSLTFQTPTANVTYRLLTAAAGTYDICTTVGNCVGLGNSVTSPGGTTNVIPKFTGAQSIGDSNISDDGSTVTIGVNLAVNTITPTAAMTIGSISEDLTLQGATVALSASDSGFTNTLTFATPAGSNKTITLPNASGTVAVSASGPLAIDANGNITCATCATGSVVSSLNGQTGAVNIANATGAGGTVTINDASTSQKGIAQFNSTNFTVTGGAVNTIQDINTTAAPTFGRLTVTSSQATNDMLLVNNTNASGTGSLLKLQLNGANRFTVDPAGNVVATGTLTSGAINGQTISSAANFTGSVTVASALNVNTITPSAAMTVGATNQNLTLQGATTAITSTSGANTTTLSFQAPTANVTYRLLTAAAGTYDLCTTAGNCVGLGGGVSTAGGTTNLIPKFTGTQTIGDSNISDDGSTVAIAVDLSVNTITPTAAMTIGATGEDLTLQGATVNLTSTAAGITNTLAFATPSGSNKTITIPNATGTVAVSASGPLALDANGNITCATCVTGNVVTSLNGQTGAVNIANASGASGTVTIDDASTSQKGIAQFNSTNFSASGGVINTIQDINTTAAPTFGRLTVTSGQASNDMLLVNNTNVSATGSLLKLQLNGANRFTVDAAGNVVVAGTITSGNINGQTISSAANFTGSVTVGTTLNVNTITPSAAMTVGATNQNLTLQGATTSLTSTSGASTSTLTFQTPTANVTYRLLTAAAGTYDICTTASNSCGGNFIQNQNTSDQTADLRISGTARANTSVLTPLLDTATAVALNLGTTNATVINLNEDTTVASGKNLSLGGNLSLQPAADSTTVIDINTNAGGNLLTVDSTNGRVGINKGSTNLPAYSLDVTGDINTTTGYRVGGTAGSTVTCSGGQYLQNLVAVGGIVTGGTCTAPAGASTLQTAYTASTGGTTPEIKLDSTRGAFDIQDANTSISANLFNVRASNASGLGQALFSVGSTGQVVLQNSVNSTTALNVMNLAGDNILTVDSTNGRVGINLGNAGLPSSTLEIGGTLRLSGTTTESFVTPGAANVPTKINIPIFDPGSFGQILALGLPSTAQSTARVLSLFDARTTAHQPSLGVFSPDESNLAGLSWEGSNSISYLKTTGGSWAIRTGTTDLALFESGGDVAIGGSNATARLHITAASGDLFKITDSTVTALDVLTIADEGATTFQNRTDSTSALKVLSAGGSNILNIDSTNGRVGIGGVAAFSKFEVTGGDAAIYNSGNNPRLILGDSTTAGQNGYLQWDSTNDYFRIESVGTNGLKINDNFVAIGNIFPDQPLKIANGSTLLAQVNTTGQAMYQNSSNSTAAFRVLTSGGGNVFSVDTTNGRVGINLGGSTAPSYSLDISGDTNTSGVYRVGGTAGISATCSGGQVLQNLVATGGIVTGGTCAASGSSSTLQQSYTASTGGTTPEIKLDSTRGALDIQDADSTIGGALLNVRAANGSGLGQALFSVGNTGQITMQNSTDSSSALQIKNANGNVGLNFDTTSVNMVTNSSFETNTTGWSAVTGNTAGNPTLTRVTSQQRSGSASLQIATNADTNEGASFAVTLSASTQYTLSFAARASSAFGSLSFGRSDNGTPIDCSTGNSVSATQWNRYNCTFTTGGTISGSFIYVRQSDATARTFFIDDVQIETGSSATPYREARMALQGGMVINALSSSTPADYGLTIMGTGQTGLGTERLFAVRNINGSSAIEYSEQVARTIITGGSSFWGTAALEVATNATDSMGLHLKASNGQTADMLRLVSNGGSTRWSVGAGDYTDTSGSKAFETLTPNFAPTSSSTASFTGLSIAPTINFAGGGAGNTTALLINPTYTAAPSGTNLLADFQNGGVSVFSVSRTGKVTSKNSTNSTTAFEILSSTNSPIFTADTTNNRAYIGSTGADTDGILLVLDTKADASDPTGVAGAMYYNSALGRMRCYVESMWRFCNDPPGMRWGYDFREDFIGDVDLGIGWTTTASGGNWIENVPDLASRPGQLTLGTSTTTTGRISLKVGTRGDAQFFIQGGEEIEFAVKINNLAVVGGQNYDVRAGLCDTDTGVCNNGVFIEYDADTSANWRFGAANVGGGGTNTRTSSSKAVATGWTTFRIVAVSSSSIEYYARHSSDSAYTFLGTISTNIPTTSAAASFPLFHIVKSQGTTDRQIQVDYFNIRNTFTTPR